MTQDYQGRENPYADPPTTRSNSGTQGAAQKKDQRWILFLGVGCAVGFGLLMLLGIVSAILIPNFQDALQKAKQKRTVADIRQIGFAVLAWEADLFQAGEARPPLPEELTAEDLSTFLVPGYLQEVPTLDGWENPMLFSINPNFGEPGSSEWFFVAWSPGRDGEFEDRDPLLVEPFERSEYDNDIIFVDGEFKRFPKD